MMMNPGALWIALCFSVAAVVSFASDGELKTLWALLAIVTGAASAAALILDL